ncbi:hypothetical protein G6011_00599 [Alternaria panax]|uniref:PAN2 UCH domain-containing protein n=1 Tax=Alternaria panax TaxID=48097 RepID=A0AAD4IJC7_9PLEO|nr:hypothetical protein G6011_00599 [Alternaria panax]
MASEIPGAFILRKLNSESLQERTARANAAGCQQDSDEFLTRLLDACRDSIDPTNHQQIDEFNYLFRLTRHEEVRCTHGDCNYVQSTSSYDTTTDLGFSGVMVARHGQNYPDIQSALANSAWLETDDLSSLTCKACNHTGDVKNFRTIEAAPEYLRINLELNTFDENGKQQVEKDNPDWPLKNKYQRLYYDSVSNEHHASADCEPGKPSCGDRL